MPFDVAAKLKHRLHSTLDSAAHLAHYKNHPVPTHTQPEPTSILTAFESDSSTPFYLPQCDFRAVMSASPGQLLAAAHEKQGISPSDGGGQVPKLHSQGQLSSKLLCAEFLPPGEAVAQPDLHHRPSQMGVVYSSWHENVCVLFADIVGWVQEHECLRVGLISFCFDLMLYKKRDLSPIDGMEPVRHLALVRDCTALKMYCAVGPSPPHRPQPLKAGEGTCTENQSLYLPSYGPTKCMPPTPLLSTGE